MKNKIFLAVILAILTLSGCGEEFLETKSTSAIDQTALFSTTESALMAINGIHRYMNQGQTYAPDMGYSTFLLWNEFLGEDLVYTRANAQFVSTANWTLHRNVTSRQLRNVYAMFYTIIANANMIIANIDNAEGTQADRDFIKAEALLYRAFFHFNLVQWWGSRYVPGENNSQLGIIIKRDNLLDDLPRSTVEEVYAFVNEDIDEAIRLFSGSSTKRRTKQDMDIHVARAIKARVLLTQGKWNEAAEMAKLVVEQSGAELSAYTYDRKVGRGCDATNSEWIWAKIAQPLVETGKLTNFYSYISNTNVSYNYNTPRAIYNLLYERISPTDVRKTLWDPEAPLKNNKTLIMTKSSKQYMWMSQKFVVVDMDCNSAEYLAQGTLYTADLSYVRLPEMMLVMAEGYARAGKYSEAANALYPLAVIRDPEYKLSSNTGEALIDEIMFQRRIELWGEGFRFLDLKRLNMDLDRGPAPREGYNQGGTANGWTTKKMPTNLDPLASNFNMYEDKPLGESSRFIPKESDLWQFLFPQNEIDRNSLVEQNPM